MIVRFFLRLTYGSNCKTTETNCTYINLVSRLCTRPLNICKITVPPLRDQINQHRISYRILSFVKTLHAQIINLIKVRPFQLKLNSSIRLSLLILWTPELIRLNFMQTIIFIWDNFVRFEIAISIFLILMFHVTDQRQCFYRNRLKVLRIFQVDYKGRRWVVDRDANKKQ